MDFLRRRSIDPNKTFISPLIIYKVISTTAFDFAQRIIEWLINRQEVEIIFVEELEKFQKQSQKISLFTDTSNPDICIVIGGDGTCLWASNIFKDRNRPPFITFNLGHLGYMAIYDCDLFQEILEELYNNKKTILFEKRSLLECTLKNEDETITSVIALNDIVVEKEQSSHMIRLKIFVDEEPLTDVRCDGLILSTSTGSTAYSLAAGGTILHYDVDALILNSICPQSLSFRAIAFPRGIKLKVTNIEPNVTTYICYDGIDKLKMSGTLYVEIKLADQYVNFILLEKFIKNRVAVWRQKIVEQLGWNNPFINITDKK
jgi:NAD kinase